MFNSGWNKSTILQSHRTGRRFGLEMVLDIDQFDYMSGSGDTAGVRLVVHDGKQLPFPEDQGLMISPGCTTSIGMQKTVVTRLGPPYDDCVDTSKQTHDLKRNVYEELYPDTYYSVEGCSRTCYQRYVIERCQCGDIYYPLSGTAFDIGGQDSWPPCLPSNTSLYTCQYNVQLDFNANKLECDCPLACTDQFYSSDMSIGDWPSDVTRAQVFTQFQNDVRFNIWDNVTYKDNLINVQVFFEEFNYEEISENPAYPSQSYLSDIGGSLGLFLGMSLMSFIEFFELFVDIIIYVILLCRARPSPRSATGNEDKDAIAKDADGTSLSTSSGRTSPEFDGTGSKALLRSTTRRHSQLMKELEKLSDEKKRVTSAMPTTNDGDKPSTETNPTSLPTPVNGGDNSVDKPSEDSPSDSSKPADNTDNRTSDDSQQNKLPKLFSQGDSAVGKNTEKSNRNIQVNNKSFPFSAYLPSLSTRPKPRTKKLPGPLAPGYFSPRDTKSRDSLAPVEQQPRPLTAPRTTSSPLSDSTSRQDSRQSSAKPPIDAWNEPSEGPQPSESVQSDPERMETPPPRYEPPERFLTPPPKYPGPISGKPPSASGSGGGGEEESQSNDSNDEARSNNEEIELDSIDAGGRQSGGARGAWDEPREPGDGRSSSALDDNDSDMETSVDVGAAKPNEPSVEKDDPSKDKARSKQAARKRRPGLQIYKSKPKKPPKNSWK